VEHPSHFVQVGDDPLECGWRDVAEIAAQDQQVLGLGGGALGNVQEARVLLLPLPA
jgi:hypothetical protein